MDQCENGGKDAPIWMVPGHFMSNLLNDAGARRTDSNVCHVSSTSGMGALTMHHVGSQEPKHFVLGAFYSQTPGSDGHERGQTYRRSTQPTMSTTATHQNSQHVLCSTYCVAECLFS